MRYGRLAIGTFVLTFVALASCSSSNELRCHLAQIAADFKTESPLSLLPYAKLSAPSMIQYSDGSLYFFSSSDSKDVTVKLESPSRGGIDGTTSIRASAVEVVPSPANDSYVLHIFGREGRAEWASAEMTEVVLHPKVWFETWAALK
jgi:hypothetical protein